MEAIAVRITMGKGGRHDVNVNSFRQKTLSILNSCIRASSVVEESPLLIPVDNTEALRRALHVIPLPL